MNTTNATSSCLSSLSQINKTKHLLDTKSLLNLINPLIFSKLYYCFPVWSSISKKNISKLQNIQHCTARMGTCSTCKYDHITPVLRELEWLFSSVYAYLLQGRQTGVQVQKGNGIQTILLIDSRGLILPAGTLKIRIRLIFQVTNRCRSQVLPFLSSQTENYFQVPQRLTLLNNTERLRNNLWPYLQSSHSWSYVEINFELFSFQ